MFESPRVEVDFAAKSRTLCRVRPSTRRVTRTCVAVLVLLLCGGAGGDVSRDAVPPEAPRFKPPSRRVLLASDFSHDSLGTWKPDRPGVWSLRHGALRAQLADEKQLRSFIYSGSEDWTDYAVDLDVCMMRGVDKGLVVRQTGDHGIAVDLRGPGYQDLLLQYRQWPLARARIVNDNGAWHHLRIEAVGHRYRVFVDGARVLDQADRRRCCVSGGIALVAYTGGVGACTVYYDNVIVTALD